MRQPPPPPIRSALARLAITRRWHPADHPKVTTAQRDLRVEQLADHIVRVVDAAPPLTTEQRVRLAELLEPVRIGPRGAVPEMTKAPVSGGGNRVGVGATNATAPARQTPTFFALVSAELVANTPFNAAPWHISGWL